MNSNRKIPTIMFSQHPDHAGTPYWHTHPYIQTHDEIHECLRMFQEFGGEEVMWDWEGKFADESVVEKLLMLESDFFSKYPLGKKFFLTLRIPNPDIESGYRLARAFMVMLSAQHTTQLLNTHTPPLFELILPMTTQAQQMIRLQQSFMRIAQAAHESFGSQGKNQDLIEIIPLFESVDTILGSASILREYIQQHEHTFKKRPLLLRPFCARSDPALNSGIVATTASIKWALHSYSELSKELGIHLYPIIAPGALPFRGGLSPLTVNEFLDEFQGVKTVVVQSAFRYDYGSAEVKKGIQLLKQRLTKQQSVRPLSLTHDTIKIIIESFEKPYQKTVESLAPIINRIAKFIPKRRARVQHIGLFGYSRTLGSHALPRAIGFTGSCYSLGIPPEFFGIAQGLKTIREKGFLDTLNQLYPSLRPHLLQAGKYLRYESLLKFAPDMAAQMKEVEEYVGQPLGPTTETDFKHQELVQIICEKIQCGQDPSKEIEEAAVLRKSVG